MSLGISSTLTEVLARSAGVDNTRPVQVRAIGGGSINATYHVTTSRDRQWFCKINDARRFPDLFVLERQGLALLGATATIRVPEVIACEVIAGKHPMTHHLLPSLRTTTWVPSPNPIPDHLTG